MTMMMKMSYMLYPDLNRLWKFLPLLGIGWTLMSTWEIASEVKTADFILSTSSF